MLYFDKANIWMIVFISGLIYELNSEKYGVYYISPNSLPISKIKNKLIKIK